jgi:murein biosynthesis integral membrane protein MurJ
MLAGLALDVVIAARLGANAGADALLVGLSLPLLVDVVTREGTKFSLVPVFVRQHDELDPQASATFVTRILNGGLLLGVTCAALAALLAPTIVRLIGPGLDAAHRPQATQVLRLAGFALLLAPSISLLSAHLNARRSFSPVASRSLVTRGSALILATIVVSFLGFPERVALGYSFGFLVFALGLVVAARLTGFRYSGWQLPGKRELALIGVPTLWPLMGLIVARTTRLAEWAIASTVAVGGLAAFYFAFRVFSAAQTLIGVSLATTRLPVVSAHAAQGDRGQITLEVRRMVVRAVLLALPLAVGCLLFARPLVAAVYGRGEFGEASVQLTSRVLVWLALGLLPNCSIPVLNATLYALGRYRVVFAITAICALLDVAAAWTLSRFLGVPGIAVAVSATSALIVGCQLVVLGREGILLWGPLASSRPEPPR